MNIKITYNETNTQDQKFEREQVIAVEPSGDVESAARLAFWQEFDTAEDVKAAEITGIEIM